MYVRICLFFIGCLRSVIRFELVRAFYLNMKFSAILNEAGSLVPLVKKKTMCYMLLLDGMTQSHQLLCT